MKLLLDQHLSFRLVPQLDRIFPFSKHVKDFGLTDKDDRQIWDLARDEGFAIVSKDSDFQSRSLVHGHPPKVIQLRIGNCPTSHILDLITKEETIIKQFLDDPSESLLVLE